MFGKMAAAGLLGGAFAYALWLRLSGKPLPEASGRKGWGRGFIWATVLLASWMGCGHGGAGESSITCYMAPPMARTEVRPGLMATVRAASLSLDGARGEALRAALEQEVAGRKLSADAARLLRIAFRETAYHYYRARGRGAMATCYDMPGEQFTLMETREHLLTRMELLVEAGRKGRIDTDIQTRVGGELARDLAAFGAYEPFRAGDVTPEIHAERLKIVEAMAGKTIPVDAAASEAANVLIDIARNAPEGWAAPSSPFLGIGDREKTSKRAKPGAWEPPPPLSREDGGF